jgi:all-trans-retinol 13,14-reductase
MMNRSIGESYRRAALEESWDAIVIGSGVGGLTAAALLARHAGRRVLVLERHYTAGGFTHVFHRPGYEWDVGVHYVGDEPQTRRLFDGVTGGRLQWSRLADVYDRIVIGGREYDYAAGARAWRDTILSSFPNEKCAIDGYLKLVRETAQAARLYFAEKALPGPVARVAGGFLRGRFLRQARRTTADLLRSLTANRDLAAVLTGQWGDYGETPSRSSFGAHALVAESYLEGALYPTGGASSIAGSILSEIEEQGGRVVVNAEVSRVLVDSANRAIGVRMADGREFRSGVVISDAGAVNTFTRLLPYKGMRQQLRSIPRSSAHLSLYVGLRGTAGELGLPRTNLWIYPGVDHDHNAAAFASDMSKPLPVVFISFPSAKDPTFEQRCPGRATIEVISMAPYAPFAQWADTRWKKRGTEYEELKSGLAARLLEALHQAVPGVRGRIEHAELSTPLTTAHFAGHEQGEIYGLAPTPERFELRCLRPATTVSNLYLTGADVTVAGVAPAMIGGILCASSILRRNLMSATEKYEAPRVLRAAA